MPEVSDMDLVERWRAGDRKAGDQLVTRYFDELRAFMINSVSDQDCADVLQDTFRRLVGAVSNFSGSSSFRTYLYSIARRARADYFRARYQGPGEFDPSIQSVEDIEALTPSEAVALLERGRQLNDCLRKEPIDDREIVELFYWHGWRATEIAALLEVPDATIRTRLHRTRMRLRRCLKMLDDVPRGEVEPDDSLEEQLQALGRELEI